MKTGRRLIKQARFYRMLWVESPLTSLMFESMLRRIEVLRQHAG